MLFSKVDELVEPGEEVEQSVHPSRFDSEYVKPILTSAGLFLGVTGILVGNIVMELGLPTPLILASYLIPLMVYARGDIKRRFVMYHFTDREIIEEFGIMNKDFNSIPYERIQDVVLDEDVEERIFDVGDIHIRTAGTDNSEQVLNGLKNPESYKVEIGKRATSGSDRGGSQGQSSGMEMDSGGGVSSGASGASGSSVDQGVLDDELERVENQIQQLNQRSNTQGLSESERERWYKLEGQRELLERWVDQGSDGNSSGLNI
jgi:membrane protein YdbS with pleckstrin-like domain